mgnify:CR=1 FL=1
MPRSLKHWTAMAALLSGLLLVPFVGLPTQAFGWQLFANAYQPALTVNYDTGAPGSYFNLRGSGLPANASGTVTVNGQVIGTITTDALGNVDFTLHALPTAAGYYQVVLSVNPTVTTLYRVSSSAPQHAQSGGAPVFDVGSAVSPNPVLHLTIIAR